jgi:hypothetical protein
LLSTAQPQQLVKRREKEAFSGLQPGEAFSILSYVLQLLFQNYSLGKVNFTGNIPHFINIG